MDVKFVYNQTRAPYGYKKPTTVFTEGVRRRMSVKSNLPKNADWGEILKVSAKKADESLKAQLGLPLKASVGDVSKSMMDASPDLLKQIISPKSLKTIHQSDIFLQKSDSFLMKSDKFHTTLLQKVINLIKNVTKK
ncbi:MAG TPA: hypothetical protein P5556_06165 [Candidatus Gastranaerophilales bacterium]|nr:hypothetical protein [Candidatus Gastranaerophilales bacterium]